jgi:FkbM family methyltransferase
VPRTQNLDRFVRKLRPRKVRGALRRRWFENRLERTRLRDTGGVLELGSKYGGWIVPGELIGPGWTCYSVAAGGDVSFDMELIRRYGATVRAVEPVAGYVEEAIEACRDEPRFSVHQAAITTSNGPIRMQVTHDEGSRSVSGAGLYESETFVELPGRTLPSLMAELGDDHIDLLKLDVEGGEYELIPTLDLRAMGVKIFAVQLHHTGSVADARRLIEWLREAGYEPVGRTSAVKLTFASRELMVTA